MTGWIEGNLKLFELKFIVNCFCSVLRIYNEHVSTLEISGEIMEVDMLESFEKMMEMKVKGVEIEEECGGCGQQIGEEMGVVYYCGHGCHLRCCGEE